MRLTGVRALVTGATSGIGQAIAEAYGREGASVVVAGRDASRAEAVVRTLEAAGATATAIVADLRTPDGVAALLAAAGEVDVLVNNAGIYPFGATADTNGAAFDEVIQINVRAPYFLTAALAPRMAARGHGRVINVTTIAAHVGTANGGLYGASNAALELLTKAWATEYGPSGVNVNAIAPGPTRTPGTAPFGAALDQLGAAAPAGRPAEPAEIAGAAVYLASDAASFLHGATIVVDGGHTSTR